MIDKENDIGMSMYIRGFISKEDDIYKKQCAVLRACYDGGISELPKETAEYFNSPYPDICLIEEKIEIEIPVTEWNEDMSSGYELKISDIPEGVEIIRFYNSY